MSGTDYAKEGIVHIENLVKRYGSLVALDHLNLDIREGEIFGLLGPNGSGKTTAINCILALLKYDKGSIRIFGKEMEPDNYEAKRGLEDYRKIRPKKLSGGLETSEYCLWNRT